MIASFILSLLALTFSTHCDDPDLTAALKAHAAKYDQADFTKDFVFISVEKQCLYHYHNWELVDSYPVSTGKAGLGCASGSNKTPSGLHIVKEKYGDKLPEGAILKSRTFTGKVATIHTDDTDVEEDHVTTRIMWLQGMEPGHNKGTNAEGKKVDSHGRYIYIHGTPEEGLIGAPHSHGCVRMINRDVITVYDALPSGTPVLIMYSV